MLSASLFPLLVSATSQEQTFLLGALGPFMSVDQRYLVAMAAFDIDFRKNHDQDLRTRFGPPIVNISNLDPALRLNLQVGTSDGDRYAAASSAVDMPRGDDAYSQPVAIIAGTDAEIFTPLSST